MRKRAGTQMRSPTRFDDARILSFRAKYKPQRGGESTFLLRRNLLAKAGRYEVYYAPLECFPKRSDRLILVGISPAQPHMKAADKVFRAMTESKRNDSGVYSRAIRSEVAFFGSAKVNLCAMLDDVGLPSYLKAHSAEKMFEPSFVGVATTSALVFPTFKDGSGISARPPWLAVFDEMLALQLVPRLKAAPKALIIPLGVAAEQLVDRALKNCDALTAKSIRSRVLEGFPHPTPRYHKQQLEKLAKNRSVLRQDIQHFFLQR